MSDTNPHALKIKALDPTMLKQHGYTVEANQWGCRVEHNGKFIYGSGVKGKPTMHWRHARANRQMFVYYGWMEARRHFDEHQKDGDQDGNSRSE